MSIFNGLPPQLVSLGEFIGFLKKNGEDWEVNTDWFKNPLNDIKDCGDRVASLVAMLETVMDVEIGPTPPVFERAQWYPFSNPTTGSYSDFHLVASPSGSPSGQIGFGCLHYSGGGEILVESFFYIPVFAYDQSGSKFILHDKAHPVQVGVNTVTSGSFVVNSTVHFTGLDIQGNIYLSGDEPGIVVSFQNLTGTTKPAQYTTLKSLLDPDVSSWLLEVVLNASPWLDVFISNTTYTVGDLLEETTYLQKDDTFYPENFTQDPITLQLTVLGTLVPPYQDADMAPVYQHFFSRFTTDQQNILRNPSSDIAHARQTLADGFNAMIKGDLVYDDTIFKDVFISQLAYTFLAKRVTGAKLVKLNRILIEDVFRYGIEENPYQLNIAGITGSPVEIASRFLFDVLDTLSWFDIPLIFLPYGGIFVDSRKNSDGSTDYGIRLAGSIQIDTDPANDGQAAPVITLCLGSWLSNEDDSKNWMLRSTGAAPASIEPGIGLFALRRDSSGNLSFVPGFSLTSTGFDVSGSNDSPLVNLNGYSFNEVELRINVDSQNWELGGACKLDTLCIPLGPGFPTSSSGNPVAQNVLSSATPGSTGGDKDPVNPSFSIAVAYTHGGKTDVQLYDKYGNPGTTAIFPVNRRFGPLQCDGIGIGWIEEGKQLSLLFDGSVELPSLNIYLDELTVNIPVTDPADFSQYGLDINGMGITFEQDPIEFSATLIKIPSDPLAHPPRNYIEYDGEAFLKAESFVISALGSYAYIKDPAGGGYASFFLFGMYVGDLGGPPFFYVTGLAAGFGYNRQILLPDQASVMQFPLVAAMNDPSIMGAQKQPDGSWKSPDPATALASFDQYVPAQRGEYWLAAGVKFTSFNLVHTSALLSVEFGQELEIGITGLSWMSLPPPPAPDAGVPDTKYAYAELGIEVKILPNEGFLGATAILSPNSFLIDPSCVLTGGYAFYLWFGNNAHAGDFVMTLGGYHPSFQAPAHYPVVPRLGFLWSVSDDVSIMGYAYFALTPSAAMAGGGLQVLYSTGGLSAWFTAQMDALIVWAPFHYVIDIGVSVGVSYRMHLVFVTVTVGVELGADLTIWGPSMGGEVYINWYIISFTISFGADRSDSPPPLDWTNTDGTGFAETLLSAHMAGTGNMLHLAPTADDSATGLFAISITDGLGGTITKDGKPVWLVSPNNFTFSAASAIPSTQLQISVGKDKYTIINAADVSPAGKDYYLCFRPMKATLSSSTLTITLTDCKDGNIYDLADKFDFEYTLEQVPAAKWGKPVPDDSDPEYSQLLDGRLMGISKIKAKYPVLTPSGDAALDIDITTAYTYDIVNKKPPFSPYHLPLDPDSPSQGTVPIIDDGAIKKVHDTLMSSDAIVARTNLFTAMQELGLNITSNGSLETFGTNPGKFLNGEPRILHSAGLEINDPLTQHPV